MNQEQTVSALESSIERYKTEVNFGKAAIQLHSNQHFKTVVLNGYLKDEAVRLVHAKADPAMQTPERQASIIKDIDAIGSFATYLRQVMAMTASSAHGLEVDEATLADVLAEM